MESRSRFSEARRQSSDALNSSTRSKCQSCATAAVCPISSLPVSLAEQIHRVAEHRFYAAGRTIANQGQAAKALFIVKSGWVKAVFNTKDGRQFSVGLFGPGSILGLPEVITNGRFGWTTETAAVCEIELVAGPRLLALLDVFPSLAMTLLRLVSCQFLKSVGDVYENSAEPTATRLLKVLKDLALQGGRRTAKGIDLELPFTVQDLADRVGCSRQWATKALAELEAKGLVRRKRGCITVSASVVGQSASPKLPGIVRLPSRES